MWARSYIAWSTLCAPRAPYRRASFYPLVHFFKSKPSTCTCFLPSPPLSALPRSVSIMWWQKFKELPFVKSWRYGTFGLNEPHLQAMPMVYYPAQYIPADEVLVRVPRQLAQGNSGSLLSQICSSWNTFVTTSSPKAPWDQSDRVTLLPTRRPPLTRHMALHQWVATFFISDIMTALNWICWAAWRVIIELTFCWGCWMFPVIPLNSNSNNFSNYVIVNETSTKCTFNSHIFQSC